MRRQSRLRLRAVQVQGAVNIMTFNGRCGAPGFLLRPLVLAAGYIAHGAALAAVPQACITAAKSSLIVNVRDQGAKGEDRTDDTAAIQAMKSEGKGLVLKGTYVGRREEAAPRAWKQYDAEVC